MKNEKAIIIKGLSKEYYKKDSSRSGFFDRLKPNKSGQSFFALKDINLEINRGEVIGIIGPNGAGKSTLLKILAEVTPPTSGSVEIFGKVASILEIGIGFQPELSGYENIFLSGQLYGLSKKQINNEIEEIVDLFGFKDFIHTEVKHYSSGMHMRLAFAIIVHIYADIYLFDEILSVGDLAFQNKVIKVMSALKAKKATILIVTHSPTTILSISDYFVILKDSQLITKATPNSALMEYQELVLYNKSNFEISPQRLLIENEDLTHAININQLTDSTKVKIFKAEILNLNHPSQDYIFSDQKIAVRFKLNYTTNQSINFGFTIKNFNSVIITHHMYNIDLKCNLEEQTLLLETQIPANEFNNFNLKIDFFVMRENEIILLYQNILQFNLISSDQNIFQNVQPTIGYLNLNNLIDKITHQ